MNKQQIKNKMIKLGLKTNWNHFWTMIIMLSILVGFSVISWFLFIEALSAPNLPYNEEMVSQDINLLKTYPTPQILPNLPIVARITCYTETGNLTASGKIPKNGMVAVSDRSIPFGTEIIIDNQTYIVEDRTNKRFENLDLMTVDIFWEGSVDSCLEFGVKYKNIIIK